ncbi:MAG: hypothetical protein J5780_00230 [Treponema sp.]|nr:hypothetical protein [Treponema sp.]
MKKMLALTALVVMTAAEIFAYNPPVGGEDLFKWTSPDLIMGGASATGGAFLNVVPPSICYNPALTAREDRTMVDFSGTLFFNSEKVNLPGDEDSFFGAGFQLGTIIPTRYYVFTVTGQGLFSGFNTFDVKDSVVFHGGASKDIIENRLYVGMNIYAGFYFGDNSDFTIGVDFGALYYFEKDIGILKKPRMGFSLLNVGKPLSGYETYGYDYDNYGEDSSYPGILTPRASFAATLFDTSNFDGFFSTDVSFPTFQNVVLDFSFATTFLNLVTLSAAYQVNFREMMEDVNNAVTPSIGLNFHFEINSSKLNKPGWERSQVLPSFAWQEIYKGIHAASFGFKANLGMADKSAPEIILWDEE